MTGKGALPSPSEGPKAIFVLGSPRSGTTVLGEALGAHPQALNARESGLIAFANELWWPSLHRMSSPFKSELLREFEQAIAGFLEKRAILEGKDFIVDHTPHNALYADRLEVFANPRFVHVIRNGIDVCLSLRQSYRSGRDWAGATTVEQAAMWYRYVNSALALRGDSRYFEVRYESFVSDPRRVLEGLCSSLEIPYSPAVLAPLSTMHAQSYVDGATEQGLESADSIGVEFMRTPAAKLYRSLGY